MLRYVGPSRRVSHNVVTLLPLGSNHNTPARGFARLTKKVKASTEAFTQKRAPVAWRTQLLLLHWLYGCHLLASLVIQELSSRPGSWENLLKATNLDVHRTAFPRIPIPRHWRNFHLVFAMGNTVQGHWCQEKSGGLFVDEYLLMEFPRVIIANNFNREYLNFKSSRSSITPFLGPFAPLLSSPSTLDIGNYHLYSASTR